MHCFILKNTFHYFLQEHKKIVFFYPKETDIDTQIKHIGLCEAIVRFTEYVTHLKTHNPKLSFIHLR